MDFGLSGKGREARSSQTATRLLAVLWFESLLLVWRLHGRTIRPVARFLFAESARAIACVFERNLSKGSCFPSGSPFKEECVYELLDFTRCRAGRRQRNSETYDCLRLRMRARDAFE